MCVLLKKAGVLGILLITEYIHQLLDTSMIFTLEKVAKPSLGSWIRCSISLRLKNWQLFINNKIIFFVHYRQRSLDWIADKTNGAAFTVTEARQNMASSYISTYFKLTNVLYSITEMYYQGSRSDLPMEVSLEISPYKTPSTIFSCSHHILKELGLR